MRAAGGPGNAGRLAGRSQMGMCGLNRELDRHKFEYGPDTHLALTTIDQTIRNRQVG